MRNRPAESAVDAHVRPADADVGDGIGWRLVSATVPMMTPVGRGRDQFARTRPTTDTTRRRRRRASSRNTHGTGGFFGSMRTIHKPLLLSLTYASPSFTTTPHVIARVLRPCRPCRAGVDVHHLALLRAQVAAQLARDVERAEAGVVRAHVERVARHPHVMHAAELGLVPRDRLAASRCRSRRSPAGARTRGPPRRPSRPSRRSPETLRRR